jgi:hypothetical protein
MGFEQFRTFFMKSLLKECRTPFRSFKKVSIAPAGAAFSERLIQLLIPNIKFEPRIDVFGLGEIRLTFANRNGVKRTVG